MPDSIKPRGFKGLPHLLTPTPDSTDNSMDYFDISSDHLIYEDFDEALADELAREWELEQATFSPFSGTYLGDVECKEGLDD